MSMNPKSNSSSSYSSGSENTIGSWLPQFQLAGAAAAAAMVAYAVLSARLSSRCRSQVVGIIPARFASSRFPGKPLVPILGKPMIQRTWERAKLATTLHKLVVATDDHKIAKCCLSFGADVLMTSESCKNGTERCNEALRKLQRKFDIVVNIQGDEPLIEPEIIDGVVKALQWQKGRITVEAAHFGMCGKTVISDHNAAPDAVFSTAATSLKPEDALDPNRVKCVVNTSGYAIYFSRGLIPFNKSGKVDPTFPYLLDLGIQSYDAKFLRMYTDLSPTPLQLEEDLEQLKVLEHGYKMKVIKVVDTPEDVEKIESLMRQRNIS